MPLRSADEPFLPGKSRRVASGDKVLRTLSRSYFQDYGEFSFVQSAAYARPMVRLRSRGSAVRIRPGAPIMHGLFRSHG